MSATDPDGPAVTALPAYVTGGSGFIGRRLIAELVRQGRQVRALARSPAAAATGCCACRCPPLLDSASLCAAFRTSSPV